jgi:hypothetical protein
LLYVPVSWRDLETLNQAELVEKRRRDAEDYLAGTSGGR